MEIIIPNTKYEGIKKIENSKINCKIIFQNFKNLLKLN